MKRCRQKGYNGDYGCWRAGWLLGFCWHHALAKVRAEWSWRALHASFDLSDFSLPYVRWDDERPVTYVVAGFGTEYGDPGFEVGVNFRRRGIDWSGPLTAPPRLTPGELLVEMARTARAMRDDHGRWVRLEGGDLTGGWWDAAEGRMRPLDELPSDRFSMFQESWIGPPRSLP